MATYTVFIEKFPGSSDKLFLTPVSEDSDGTPNPAGYNIADIVSGGYIGVATIPDGDGILGWYYLGVGNAAGLKGFEIIEFKESKDTYRPASAEVSASLELLGTMGPGQGENATVITVRNDLGQPLNGIIVYVTDEDNVTQAWGRTNNSGVVALTLNAGDFLVKVQTLSGYADYVPQEIAVPDDDTVLVTLTSQTIDPPATPGLCSVRFLVRVSGVPVEGASVEAILENAASTVSTAVEGRVILNGTTDEDGLLDLVMVQRAAFTKGDGIYKVTVRDSTGATIHTRKVYVPSQTSTYFEKLPTVS